MLEQEPHFDSQAIHLGEAETGNFLSLNANRTRVWIVETDNEL